LPTTKRRLPGIESIDARWAPKAREVVERALLKAGVAGGVLALFKTHDERDARWAYAVYDADRIEALRATLESRGLRLLYELDGLRVAISNARHASELDGKVLDRAAAGYLTALLR